VQVDRLAGLELFAYLLKDDRPPPLRRLVHRASGGTKVGGAGSSYTIPTGGITLYAQ
jgi:hypothetical protein